MLRCMTSAIAGLKANMTGIDVTGNNISNVNTDAFKSSSVSFRDTMYQEISGATANSANAAGTNPSQIGYGSAASSVNVDITAGGQNATGKASDVYIKGDGYLIVGSSSKNADDTFDDYKYTRLGTLSWDSAGYLTAGAGNYVVGYQYDADNDTMGTTLQAIHLPTPAAGKTISNISIASNGTITCNNGGKIVTVGQIALATFTNPGGLSQLGNSFYGRTDNSGNPNYIEPGTDGTNTLITGSLEASNVDLATEISNMIIYERGYQANTKVVSVADEMLQTLVNMK
jgi:flagellar hook protein FlgE